MNGSASALLRRSPAISAGRCGELLAWAAEVLALVGLLLSERGLRGCHIGWPLPFEHVGPGGAGAHAEPGHGLRPRHFLRHGEPLDIEVALVRHPVALHAIQLFHGPGWVIILRPKDPNLGPLSRGGKLVPECPRAGARRYVARGVCRLGAKVRDRG